tara:strand:+ start:1575 stop:2000 length:426 start_codon:yes stop_codon:yes gene_type:complete
MDYIDNEYNITSCPITMTDFTDGDEIICLPCKHIFTPELIKKWIMKNRNCPICRTRAIPSQCSPFLYKNGEEKKYVICKICSKSKYRNSYKGLDKNFKCGNCRKKDNVTTKVTNLHLRNEDEENCAIAIRKCIALSLKYGI